MPVLVCTVPVCPIRAESAHKSEQVSQLLFGEKCELLERTKDFVRVKVLFDDYEGWCQANQLEEIEDSQIDMEHEQTLFSEWINEIRINDQMMLVPFGSAAPADTLLEQFRIEYKGSVIKPTENIFNEELLKRYSYKYINTPYLWGGRSVFGVDCSGFVQVVFNCLNIKLPRDAYQQATQGEAIGFLQEVKCGDLAFFDNEAGRITHVGILLDATTIIHASGKVRVDTIDNFGIVNSDTGKRTHNLRVIKRIRTSKVNC